MTHPSVIEDGTAAAVFGDALPVAERYADLLRGDGVAHGHLGPREAERVWERHLLNCAVVTGLLPNGARVVDVGSGAGLPGLPMAIRRPDLHLSLLEPMQRRVDFLRRCVDELGLADRVDVVRGRAGDPSSRDVGRSSWVTARAVAPLDRLVGWCVSLLADDGVLLALKGRSAADEVAQHGAVISRAGLQVLSLDELPAGADVSRVIVLGRRVRGGQRTTLRRGGR
ncbi:MAG: 16S rRNA (guanine(527)-N(7))-methyltransferase RsmG [Jatrophihabitans endophyticus]|nr:16S rRNA (guanine(527)-N(7))-methyltransferase RsmG [Jatrophihabitans endophyticus]